MDISLTVSDEVVLFDSTHPFHNSFPAQFTLDEQTYRNVQEFYYVRLFQHLSMWDVATQLRSCENLLSLAVLARQTLSAHKDDAAVDAWLAQHELLTLHAGIQAKFGQNDSLKTALLDTKHALLIDCTTLSDADSKFCSVGVTMDEFSRWRESQATVPTAQDLMTMMLGAASAEESTLPIGQNKNGLVLMLVRQGFEREVQPMPSTASFTVSAEIVSFSKVDHPFHLLHQATFTVDDDHYDSVEQYCNVQLLRHLDQKTAAQKVLQTPNPAQCRAASRSYLRSFTLRDGSSASKVTEWRETSEDLVLQSALKAKFTQHPDFCRMLLDTGDALIVYCDKTDENYGVGFTEDDFIRWVEWKSYRGDKLYALLLDARHESDSGRNVKGDIMGSNKLGLALMAVRQILRSERVACSAFDLEEKLTSEPVAPADVAEVDHVEVGTTLDEESTMNVTREQFLRSLTLSNRVVLLTDARTHPLSVFCPGAFTVQGQTFSTVFHYVVYRLFEWLDWSREAMETLSVSNAARLYHDYAFKRVVQKLKDGTLKPDKLFEWVDKHQYACLVIALRSRLNAHVDARQVLMDTGQALIVDLSSGKDFGMPCSVETFEQFLRDTGYSCKDIVQRLQMLDVFPAKRPSWWGLNANGVALMQVRQEILQVGNGTSFVPPTDAEFTAPIILHVSTNALNATKATPSESLFKQLIEEDSTRSQYLNCGGQVYSTERLLPLVDVHAPLSSFFNAPFEVDGVTFSSPYHYALYQLLVTVTSSTEGNLVLETESCEIARRRALEVLLQHNARDKAQCIWKNEIARWLSTALDAKFIEYPELNTLLADTEQAVIVDAVPLDDTLGLSMTFFELQATFDAWHLSKSARAVFLLHGYTGCFGTNLSGVELMRRRAALKLSLGTANEKAGDDCPLCRNAGNQEFSLEPMMRILPIFGQYNVLSPAHPRFLEIDGQFYCSVEHYVRQAILREFGTPNQTNADDWLRYVNGLEQLRKQVAALWTNGLAVWMHGNLLRLYERAYRTLFQQYPSMIDCLLKTKDSLLVFVCARGTTDCTFYEWAELGCGFDQAEHFIAWVDSNQVPTGALVDWWTLHTSLRPGILQRNNIGRLLMLLRRELAPRDVQPAPDLRDVINSHIASFRSRDPFFDPTGQLQRKGKGLKFYEGHFIAEHFVSVDGAYNPLSFLYPSPMRIGDETFESVEHYFCYRLMSQFKLATEDMRKLMASTEPRNLRFTVEEAIKRKLDPGVAIVDVFPLRQQVEVIRSACLAKFLQHPQLWPALFSNFGCLHCCEANDVWGVGMMQSDLEQLYNHGMSTLNLLAWTLEPRARPGIMGGNIVGLIMLGVRKELMNKFEITPATYTIVPSVPCTEPKVADSMYIFHEPHPFGPGYLASFRINDEEYPSMEHYFWSQCLYALDLHEDSELVMQEPTAADCANAGHQALLRAAVSDYRFLGWCKKNKQTVWELAAKLKYEQNSNVHEVLLNSSNALLVYASAQDADYGVGLSESDFRKYVQQNELSAATLLLWFHNPAMRPSNIGSNKLGMLLMDLRQQLRSTLQNEDNVFGIPALLDTEHVLNPDKWRPEQDKRRKAWEEGRPRQWLHEEMMKRSGLPSKGDEIKLKPQGIHLPEHKQEEIDMLKSSVDLMTLWERSLELSITKNDRSRWTDEDIKRLSAPLQFDAIPSNAPQRAVTNVALPDHIASMLTNARELCVPKKGSQLIAATLKQTPSLNFESRILLRCFEENSGEFVQLLERLRTDTDAFAAGRLLMQQFVSATTADSAFFESIPTNYLYQMGRDTGKIYNNNYEPGSSYYQGVKRSHESGSGEHSPSKRNRSREQKFKGRR